jgi:signal transduction histidine kinase
MRKWLVRLQSLTDNLLEYGKTWTVQLHPGKASEVLRQAIDTMHDRAVDQRVRIEGELAGADAMVLMDSSRLVLVFENLIANAVQHSPAGESVTIDTARDGEQIEIAVRDRGPGFRPADLPRVFQPFFTRRRGGTGLGLSIVQRIVDEHGGIVAASNDPAGGAVIHVRLPVYEPPS